MIHIAKLQRDDLARIEVQEVQRKTMLELSYFQDHAIKMGPSWTVRENNRFGRILLCAGFLTTKEKAIGWALLASEKGPSFVAITRKVKEFCERMPQRKVQIAIDPGFEESRRWAEMIGFNLVSVHSHLGHNFMVYERGAPCLAEKH